MRFLDFRNRLRYAHLFRTGNSPKKNEYLKRYREKHRVKIMKYQKEYRKKNRIPLNERARAMYLIKNEGDK